MKKINLLIFGITLVIGLSYYLICSTTYAQTGNERSARIDISSENKFAFTGVKSNGVVTPDPTKGWIAHLDLRALEGKQRGKWQEMWVEFTPEESGFVLIIIRGAYYNDLNVNRHEVWIDDVSIEGVGSEITNGSFERIDSKGSPTNWFWPAPSKDSYSTNGSQARTGRNCILVWHDAPITQRIGVKAGNKYKVSAWFKTY